MRTGIIIIDKPKGYTSHDVIAVLRGIFHMRRIGHSGTLDPMATGVLPVFLGMATKACEYAAAHEKEYVAQFQLGVSTDTQDITGKVIDTKNVTVTQKDVEDALRSFVGPILQVPPMYSAIKKDGVKLYEYARRGTTIEREARPVTIFDAALLSGDEKAARYEARIRCSSGTYIRTLCADIGERLGSLAVMTELRRTRAGMFELKDALSLEETKELAFENLLDQHVLPLETVFSEYPRVQVDAYGEARIRNGAFVPLTSVLGGIPEKCMYFRVYAPDGTFLMLGRQDPLFSGGFAVFSEKNFFI